MASSSDRAAGAVLPRAGAMPWLAGALLLLAAAAATLAFRPGETVFLQPLSEDGYYSLAIARNIAAGHGITIDGVTPTNGFQPLVTLIQAGLFWLAGDDGLAIRLVLLVHWLLFVGTAALVALIAGDAAEAGPPRPLLRLAAGFLYLSASYLFLHHFNGLETGLLLFLYALAWRFLQTGRAERWGGLAALGALLGLAVLARIDAAFFVVALCARELWVRREADWLVALGRAALLGGMAFLVSSPWWAYNLIGFGSLMPISGTATTVWALDPFRLRWVLWALAVASFPWTFLGVFEGLVADLLRLPLWLAGAWLLWRYLRAPAGTAAAWRTRGFARCLAVTLLLLAAYYALSSIAFWFYSRYLAPAALIAVVALAPPVARLLVRWRFAAAGLVALSLPVLVLAALAWQGRGLYGTIMFWDQVLLVREQVPAEDRVAAGQAGTLNFFRPRTVNVDGKVNPDVHAYAGHVWDYLRARDIRWFADWPFYVEKALGPDPEAHGWHLVARRANFLLYRYEGK